MIRYTEVDSLHGLSMSQRRIMHVPMHWHTYYEVELCLSGIGKQIINGVESPLKPGVLTLLSPRDFHRIESTDTTMLELFTFCIQESVLPSSVVQLLNEYGPPYRCVYENTDFASICTDFSALYGEIASQDPFALTAARYRIGLICIEAVRRSIRERQNTKCTPVTPYGQTDLHSIQQAITYINEHYTERITRDELASMLHLNPTYLSGLFKSKLGITMSDYIMDCRMAQALHLLRYTDETVHAVMWMVGYTSSALFYRKFVEYYHMSPLEARKVCRETEKE